jgi:outer membrane protein assembly factor BamA
MVVKAKVIEEQNFLEKSNYYKEYYIDRTYARLIQLGVFKTIKPVLIEIPGTDQIEVHYYLEPAMRRTFFVEPQATNSNGYLGVNATVKYIDKNLLRGAQKFTFAISGGFESSPAVFGVQNDQTVKKETRSFNTFEFGPYIRYELPKLTPFGFLTLSKRHRPRTIMNASMNFQKRSDFQRSIVQLSYYWKFSSVDRLQTFTLGLPLLSSVSYVTIDKSADFEKRINDLNDLFLKNSYSNQFIIEDLKFGWQYNNTEKKDKRSKDIFFYNLNVVFAGNFLSLFSSKQDTVAGGSKAFLKNAYSQFVKLDNELIYSYPFKRGHSMHFKFQGGFGLPYGNTSLSLPYDYAFYAGGANDNRGWRSRTMAPGSYQKDLDSSRTITQIGDIRLGASVEYRIKISKLIRTAIFADAGNIWLMNKDVNRPGSQFSKNWYKEIGLAMGAGVRLDFNFFVLRLDAGIPIYNPYVTEGSRWIFNSHTNYNNQLKTLWGNNWKVYRGFIPVLHLGIGYPF